MKRLFFAAPLYHQNIELWLLPELKKIFCKSKITWVQSKNIHITLFFFGETEDKKIILIDEMLSNSTKMLNYQTVRIQSLGYFGPAYQPKVLWAGVDDNGWFSNAFHITMDNLKKIGYSPERDTFIPHLTLGRIKQLNDVDYFHHAIQQLSVKVDFEVTVRELILYQSILKPQGPTYIPLKKYPLKSST